MVTTQATPPTTITSAPAGSAPATTGTPPNKAQLPGRLEALREKMLDECRPIQRSIQSALTDYGWAHRQYGGGTELIEPTTGSGIRLVSLNTRGINNHGRVLYKVGVRNDYKAPEWVLAEEDLAALEIAKSVAVAGTGYKPALYTRASTRAKVMNLTAQKKRVVADYERRRGELLGQYAYAHRCFVPGTELAVRVAGSDLPPLVQVLALAPTPSDAGGNIVYTCTYDADATGEKVYLREDYLTNHYLFARFL